MKFQADKCHINKSLSK